MGGFEARKDVSIPGPTAAAPDGDAIRKQLDKILAWEPFARSERLSRFLRFTVEQALQSPDPVLKEYVIALEVFDKPKSFDPRLDPIVRVEARRLRACLREYYDTAGREDPVIIGYGRRGYVPIFAAGAARPRPGPVPVEPHIAPEQPLVPTASIAVLPLLDLSPGGDQHRLSASFREELINAIARAPGLRVASRTSTSQYEGKSFDIRQMGRELGVNYVLEGSVRTDEKRVRIAAQLYDVSDGLEVWSRAYERHAPDIFAVQEQIARIIAESLRIQLANGGERTGVPPSRANVHAYRMYIQGIQHWRNGDPEGSRGLRVLERAVAGDPRFAAARQGLAYAHTILAWFKEMRPAEAWPKAEAAARAALELDPFLAASRAIIACVRALFDRNWEGAERDFLGAIELNPTDPMPHEWYACACLAPLGRLDEALREMEVAQAIEPLSPLIQCHAGQIAFYRGEPARAVELLKCALDIEAGCWPAQWNLGRVWLDLGELDAAEDALRGAHQASGGLPVPAGHLGYCYARQGRTDRAREIAADLQRLSKSRYVSPLHLARIHIGLGEFDRALAMLDAARQHRCSRLVELLVDPVYAPLHSDPHFAAIAQAIGLPAQREIGVHG